MTRKHVDGPRLLGFVCALLGVLAPDVMGQGVSAGNKADRDQLTAIIDKWEKAWNSHDMHAFASLFHEDGVWILWTGEVWKGRNAIEEGHAAVHKTVFRNSIQRERLEELTFVGSDAAVVRFYSTLTGDERAPDKTIRSRKILIATKRAGAWKVGWGQNTRLSDSTPESVKDELDWEVGIRTLIQPHEIGSAASIPADFSKGRPGGPHEKRSQNP